MWSVEQWIMGKRSEDGVGKTSSADGALSASKRNGPDPQTSIRARGMCLRRNLSPDSRQHLTTCSYRCQIILASRGRPHPSAEGRLGPSLLIEKLPLFLQRRCYG
jgi:hypothetical protein